jgi:flagellar hook protein FlgE
LIQRNDIASSSPLTFELDFSQLSGLDTPQSSLAVSYQDGFPPGVLTGFTVGEDGIIRGAFDNGVARDLGQIRLVRFANPAGLEQQGDNLYAEALNSGRPIEGSPGQEGIGTIVAGAVELSNTDIGGSLVDLILASTMYRGNTRVITTAQQMIEELLAMRR